MQIIDDSQAGVSVNDPSTDETQYKGIYAQRTNYLCGKVCAQPIDPDIMDVTNHFNFALYINIVAHLAERSMNAMIVMKQFGFAGECVRTDAPLLI